MLPLIEPELHDGLGRKVEEEILKTSISQTFVQLVKLLLVLLQHLSVTPDDCFL